MLAFLVESGFVIESTVIGSPYQCYAVSDPLAPLMLVCFRHSYAVHALLSEIKLTLNVGTL